MYVCTVATGGKFQGTFYVNFTAYNAFVKT